MLNTRDGEYGGWMWADCRAQTGAIVGGGNKVSPVPADKGTGVQVNIQHISQIQEILVTLSKEFHVFQ